MQSLSDLRAWILADTSLKLPAENLKTFVENGTVYTVPGGPDDNRDFELKYEAVIYVLDVAIDPRYLLWLVGEWMNDNQPSHVLGDIAFDADILKHDQVEYELRLKMTEDVLVKVEDEGITLITGDEGSQAAEGVGVILVDTHPNPDEKVL